MENTERLDALRAVIAAECRRRMARDRELGQNEVASWLLRHQRSAVIDGLAELVGQVMEQFNDDARVEQILEATTQPEDYVEMLRGVSQALGVPLWLLLSLKPEDVVDACAAAQLVEQLHYSEESAKYEVLDRMMERLQPVMEGHPGMTVRRALEEMPRQIDETIRGLEDIKPGGHRKEGLK